MTLAMLERIFRALEAAGVRYLVAGGVAVNVHGYPRLTHDLDLVVQLERSNVLAAVEALAGLGYRPSLPVDARALADEETRRMWRERRNLEVFSLITMSPREPTVDLFVEEPFDFDVEHRLALRAELADELIVPIVRLETLIALKESSGRPRDLDDLEHLRRLRDLGSEHGTDG